MHLSDFVALGSESLLSFFAAANDVVFRESRAARVERLAAEARHLYLVFGSTSPPRNQEARHQLLEAWEAVHPDALGKFDDRHYALLRRESIEASMHRYLAVHPDASLEVSTDAQ
ncbi:MAG: hypothetical protein R3B07_07855 [Polyangiaceae bacterium]